MTRQQAEHARELITPEGVDLQLRIAPTGDRIGALLIDAVIIVGSLIVLTVAAFFVAAGTARVALMAAIWMLGFFVLRNFYFTAFEMGARAATPGKRAMGLRVISRDGGRLTANAVFARNLMRELEIFFPLTLLGMGGLNPWTKLSGLLWTVSFLLVPLLNRDRMRVGDLIAGTCVVLVPKRVLPPDVALQRGSGLVFSEAQVNAYGIRELQTLEAVLRQEDAQTLQLVADRIRRKIGWTDTAVPDAAFLHAYYTALRGRLESRLLFGHRRIDKNAR